MGVRDVILYLTLCCPARLLWTGIDSRVKPLQSPGSLCSGTTVTNPSEALLVHTRVHTLTFINMHTKLLCDTRLEARVTHANERGPASSRKRSVILHSSTSLQKPKSFSPPSPVIATLMEWQSGNHLFFHTQSGELTDLAPCVSFLLFKNIYKPLVLYLAPDTCNEQKLICKVTELPLIQRKWMILQKAHGAVTEI